MSGFYVDTSWLSSPAVIAAVVAGFIATIGILINIRVAGYRENRNRRRESYAKALAACVSYREYVFVVYRRNHQDPEGERIRISTEMKKVQEDLEYYVAWISAESPYVAKNYQALVDATRRIAGTAMKGAWRTPPITTDAEMIIGPSVDLSGLKTFQRKYLNAVRDHLSLCPTWARRGLRFLKFWNKA